MTMIKSGWARALLGASVATLVFSAAIGGVQAQDDEPLQPFWTQVPPPNEVLDSPDVPRTADGLPNIFSEWAPNWRTIAPNGREPRELHEGDRILPEDFASEEKYLEWVNRDLQENPSNTCVPHGGGRIMSTPYKLEIVRSGEGARFEKVVFLNEQFNIIRRAYMDQAPEPDVDVRGIWGTSTGAWEDRSGDGQMDTLVVKTTGLKGSWVEQTGLVYADGAEVQEEYWLSEDGNILHMLYTLTDPVTYAHPIQHHIWWSKPTTDAQATHDEYVCFIESAAPELLLEKYQKQAAAAAQ